MKKVRRPLVGRTTATSLSAALLLVTASGCAGGPTAKPGPAQDLKKIYLKIVDAGKFTQRSYRDPDKELASFKSYTFDSTSTENPLLEKELFKMLEPVLEARGLKRDDADPGLLVTMSFFVGRRASFVPPQTITTTRVEQVWSTGVIGLTLTGHYDAVPVTESTTTPGRTTVTHYKNITLNFLDNAKLKGGEKPKVPPLVYRADADCEDDSPDIRTVAPVMLDILINGVRTRVALDISSWGASLVGTIVGDALIVNSVAPVENYTSGRRESDRSGTHAGDIVRTIGGLPAARFVDNTRNGSFPYPIIKVYQHMYTAEGKPIHDSWSMEFDPGQVVVEVECPHEKTTKTY